jgi:outer membrane protein assembly factor BamD
MLVVAGSSCSKFRQIQKSTDWRVKYDAAFKYYEEEDYYRASILLEELLPIIRGTEEAEKAQFYYAYSLYRQKNQYLLSSHHFKSFYDTYNRSEYAEEALFMYAYSLYQQSPKYNLDQSSTREAIQSMQGFLNRYPYSEYKDQANEIIDQLQLKLEKKAYENAKQYFKLELLKAALVEFENFQRDFPDSRYNEEIGFFLIKAEYELARRSIRSKQAERYNQVVEYYLDFVDTYQNSQYLKEAEVIYIETLDELSKFAKN